MRRRASGDASRVVVRRAACRCVPPRMRPRARERADFGHETRPGREFRTRAQGGRSVPERGFVAKITQISRTRRAAARERTISPCPTYNSQSHAPHGRPRAGGPTSAHPQAAPRKPPLPANPQTARKRAAGTRGGGRQHTRAHAARHQARRATCLGRKPAHRTSAR